MQIIFGKNALWKQKNYRAEIAEESTDTATLKMQLGEFLLWTKQVNKLDSSSVVYKKS